MQDVFVKEVVPELVDHGGELLRQLPQSLADGTGRPLQPDSLGEQSADLSDGLPQLKAEPCRQSQRLGADAHGTTERHRERCDVLTVACRAVVTVLNVLCGLHAKDDVFDDVGVCDARVRQCSRTVWASFEPAVLGLVDVFWLPASCALVPFGTACSTLSDVSAAVHNLLRFFGSTCPTATLLLLFADSKTRTPLFELAPKLGDFCIAGCESFITGCESFITSCESFIARCKLNV
jgi:hypothetical protein